MLPCAYDRIKHCSILTVRNCNGCKFRKSVEEIEAGQQAARDSLTARELRPVVRRDENGIAIQTVESWWDK